MEAYKQLRKLLSSDEAIYRIACDSIPPVFIIGPQAEDPERQLDISTCIEDTLHRILENEEDLSIINAEEYDEDRVDEYTYDIDLGYVIYDFRPMSVEWVENYVTPTNHYILRGQSETVEFDIPEDLRDEEILAMVCSKVPDIIQEETLIWDLNGDGSVYSLESLVTGKHLMLTKV